MTMNVSTYLRRNFVAASRPKRSLALGKAVAGLVLGALIGAAQPAAAQFVEQGGKLTGNDADGASQQGATLALSADGNTLIVGGAFDNSSIGAAWVYVRSGGVWSQQGDKLVGTGGVAGCCGIRQGSAVALSADGNTAAVGGYCDNTDCQGAVWVFTRSGGVWSQQGMKLVGSDSVEGSQQGFSVALSADGNTLIAGAPGDGADIGAAWVFVRSAGAWTQQGTKLVGTGNSGGSEQGHAVALSADGNTALVGGPYDTNLDGGAAWVFTRSGGTWSQQGGKLVGPGAVVGVNYGALEGYSVAISADGTTAMLGGPNDTPTGPNNTATGAAWIFVQSGGTWTQQGLKLIASSSYGSDSASAVALSSDGNTAVLGGPSGNSYDGAVWVFTRSGGTWSQHQALPVGTGASGNASQGGAVAVSADGNTIASGGVFDNSLTGAAWVYARAYPINAHDFSDDGISDILWRSTSGNGTVAMWLMNGSAISSSGSLGNIPTMYSVIGQHDFDGDGVADLLWRDNSGNLSIWFMKGPAMASSASIGSVSPSVWTVMGTADMNGDGIGDLLWQDTAGDLAIWFMNGSQIASSASLGTVAPSSGWSIVWSTTGRILWRNGAGALALWQVNGSTVHSASLATVPGNWVVQGMGDFNGDGVADILWRDTSAGTVAIWFLNASGAVHSTATVGAVATSTTWSILDTGDYDGDGMSDILWTDASGDLAIWFMNAGTISSSASLGSVGTGWAVQTLNAE